VKILKWRLLIIFSLVITLANAKVALADGNHQNQDNSTSATHQMEDGSSMEGMDMGGDQSSDGHDMEGMDMSGSGSDMEGMDMEGDGGGHGHEPVAEIPPNVKVLGTFGAINLFFILIGIWNKWFRGKGDLYGNAN
jgi:hypothetical protein